MKPKVYVNKIVKEIKNNKESFHFEGKDSNKEYEKSNNEIDIIDVSDISVRQKLNEIFDSDSFVYKSKSEIILKNGTELIEDVIAIKDSNLITLSNKKISIDDIRDIKKAI